MIHNTIDEMQAQLGAPVSIHLPSHVWIELIGSCNIYCQMCKDSPSERRGGRMDFGLFCSIVDQFASGVRGYTVMNWGETLLLNPHVLEKYLGELCSHKREDAQIYLSTNGTLLDEDRCSVLMSHDVQIDVSVDGCSQTVFERIRRGASFETVMSNVRKAIELRERRSSRSPHIGFYSTIQRDNIDELVGIVEMAHRIGISRIGFGLVVEPRELRIQFTEENVHKVDEAINRSIDFGLVISEKPMRIGDFSWQGQRYTRNPTEEINAICNAPNFLAAVNETGEVSACCCWPGTLGDMKKNTFREIWSGSHFEDLRSVVNTPSAPPSCVNCSMTNRI